MALPDVAIGQSGHVTHHNTLHDWTQFDENIRYVSANNGSDSNDGRTPLQPKLTIQSAYDTHPGNGQCLDLYVGPGRYNQGATGLALNRQRPARLYGRYAPLDGPSGQIQFPAGRTVLYTSSAAATSLVSFPNPTSGLNNATSFVFDSLAFEVGGAGTSLDAGIDGTNASLSVVQNCAFNMWDRNSAYGVITKHDGVLGDDHSWWRIDNNFSKYGGLFKSSGASGQGNQFVITRNVGYGGSGSGATPRSAVAAVWLEAGQRGYMAGNQFETFTSAEGAIYWKDMYECTFIDAGAELPPPGGSAPAGPFVYMTLVGNSRGNFIQLNGTSDPDNTDILINFQGNAAYNMVIAPSLNNATSMYSGAVTNRIKDDTTDKENWIMGAGTGTNAYWWTPHFKRGSGVPNSVVRGFPGDLFVNGNGGAGTTLYVKESGSGSNTGWVAK